VTDRASFLRAIRAAPEDPLLRLVYADWLDEQDDPLGLFIRVQAELEPLRHDHDNPRAEQLRRVERDMLERHVDDWVGPLKVLATHPRISSQLTFQFRGGLVEEVALPVRSVLQHAEELGRQFPALHRLKLFAVRGHGAELAACELLSAARTLELADWVTPADARALGGSPALARQRTLVVWVGHQEDEAVCRAFARRDHFPELTELRLVQLIGGVRAGARARELNSRANALARLVNRMRREKVARVERPYGQLLPLRGDVGYEFYAGHLPDGRPVLASEWPGRLLLFVFDDSGKLRRVRRLPPAPGVGLAEHLEEKYGFVPGLIRVREFRTEELAIYVHRKGAGYWLNDLDAFLARTTEDQRRDLGEDLHSWLGRGNFVIDAGNDYLADFRGEIHSS
jgi:uncharacterized protein (TIGR02996 family)